MARPAKTPATTTGGTFEEVMAGKKTEARELDRLMALGMSEDAARTRMTEDAKLKKTLKGVKAVPDQPGPPISKPGRVAEEKKKK